MRRPDAGLAPGSITSGPRKPTFAKGRSGHRFDKDRPKDSVSSKELLELFRVVRAAQPELVGRYHTTARRESTEG